MVDEERPSPESLLPRIAAGDERAARALVEELYPLVIRIVRAHLPRRSAEEDLAQEVFIKVFRRAGQYRGDQPLSHWVSRIAVTTCIDQLRAQKRRPEYRWGDLGEEEARRLEESAADPAAAAPDRSWAARELVARLLERLDPKDRLVITMLEMEERSIAEIQAATGWSESNVKVRAFRARQKLRQWAEQWEGPTT